MCPANGLRQLLHLLGVGHCGAVNADWPHRRFFSTVELVNALDRAGQISVTISHTQGAELATVQHDACRLLR